MSNRIQIIYQNENQEIKESQDKLMNQYLKDVTSSKYLESSKNFKSGRSTTLSPNKKNKHIPKQYLSNKLQKNYLDLKFLRDKCKNNKINKSVQHLPKISQNYDSNSHLKKVFQKIKIDPNQEDDELRKSIDIQEKLKELGFENREKYTFQYSEDSQKKKLKGQKTSRYQDLLEKQVEEQHKKRTKKNVLEAYIDANEKERLEELERKERKKNMDLYRQRAISEINIQSKMGKIRKELYDNKLQAIFLNQLKLQQESDIKKYQQQQKCSESQIIQSHDKSIQYSSITKNKSLIEDQKRSYDQIQSEKRKKMLEKEFGLPTLSEFEEAQSTQQVLNLYRDKKSQQKYENTSNIYQKKPHTFKKIFKIDKSEIIKSYVEGMKQKDKELKDIEQYQRKYLEEMKNIKQQIAKVNCQKIINQSIMKKESLQNGANDDCILQGLQQQQEEQSQ